MIPLRFLPLSLKRVARRRGSSLLAASGIASAMFLFCAVEATRRGVAAATARSSEDASLVVYRENRFCPFTSRLPERYATEIAAIPGVASVAPMSIVVNNCRASLDVVVFRGVPPSTVEDGFVSFDVVDGSLAEWFARSDAALVGERLAARRGVKPGDQLVAAGVSVRVAAIVASANPQDASAAHVHLDFLRRAAGQSRGEVTQFNVRADDPARLEEVAAAIDDAFRHDEAPTWTAPEKAFVARAISDIAELAGFASWLGWGALAAVFALAANAISLAAREEVRTHGVMQALGYPENLIGRLVVAESAILSLLGGAAGLAIAAVASRFGRFTFSVEGMSVAVEADFATLLAGFAWCLAIGIGAGLVPAVRSSRLSIPETFRAV